ncbi:uncharacterized protein LOC131817592 [Mustela lutreola]|uniref:Uncharacterized protein LOC101692010 n=1 Tax=Mustela putorius furo TaxID=9669 RepID=A0A8U0T202_MUSPF|nr:uncharacterized protein LOC101692010 [Mustela putorius furo]XP_059007121.1 uncharacterized protein LOC131817592 [Mustela lutreola]
MDSHSNLSDVVSSWDKDRKFILRGWSLVFSVLATLMVLSVADGRLVYLQGSFTGYLGIWTDCRRYKCANLGQVTVLIHMSMGFMMLALTLCLILLPTMGLSFRPVFRRLTKVDLVFSFLSFSIVSCETLHPRPQISYLVTTYLCWTAGALMLWAGTLSYLNHVGMWSKRTSSKEPQVSYRRWALKNTLRSVSQQQPDSDHKHTVDLPEALTPSSLPNQSHGASQDTDR